MRHLLGAIETERLGRVGAGHPDLLEDRLILHPAKLVIKRPPYLQSC